MHEVIVYSRQGCCLCDVVKDTLTEAQAEADTNVEGAAEGEQRADQTDSTQHATEQGQ